MDILFDIFWVSYSEWGSRGVVQYFYYLLCFFLNPYNSFTVVQSRYCILGNCDIVKVWEILTHKYFVAIKFDELPDITLIKAL